MAGLSHPANPLRTPIPCLKERLKRQSVGFDSVLVRRSGGRFDVRMNTIRDVDHPKSDPRLARGFGSVKAKSRLRAWNVLQRLRLVLSDAANVAIPPPAQKTFDAEGEILEHALTKSFRIRNEAIKSLCSSVCAAFGTRP
jgi:hypothetical protein